MEKTVALTGELFIRSGLEVAILESGLPWKQNLRVTEVCKYHFIIFSVIVSSEWLADAELWWKVFRCTCNLCTTVSLETWHIYLLVYWWQCSSLCNNTVDWDEEIDSMLSLVCRSSLGCEILRCSPSCNLWWWRHHSLMGQLVSSLCSCSFRASGCCSLNLFEANNRLLYEDSWKKLRLVNMHVGKSNLSNQ